MRSLLELTKDDSQVIKAVAVISMIVFHFLGRYFVQLDWEAFDYILLPDNADWYAHCITLFAFVSGYGLCSKACSASGRISCEKLYSSLFSFYSIYIFCWIILSFIAYFWPVPPFFEFRCTFTSLTMICPTFLDWWYAFAFLVFAGVFYPIMCLVYRIRGYKGIVCAVILLCCASRAVPSLLYLYGEYVPEAILYPVFKDPIFSAGSRCCHYACAFCIGSLAFLNLKAKSPLERMLAVAGIIFASYMFVHPSSLRLSSSNDVWRLLGILDVLLFVCIVRRLPRTQHILIVVGKYSVWMWLTHRLVFGYWFAPCFYAMHPFIGAIFIIFITFTIAWIMDRTFRMTKMLIRQLWMLARF